MLVLLALLCVLSFLDKQEKLYLKVIKRVALVLIETIIVSGNVWGDRMLSGRWNQGILWF